MSKPLEIPHPKLEHAQRLTLLELNAMHYSRKHSLLTSDRLRPIGSGGNKTKDKR